MRKLGVLVAAVVLCCPVLGRAQGLDSVASALGAGSLRSIQVTGSGVNFQIGQNAAPDEPWPRFNVKSLTRER